MSTVINSASPHCHTGNSHPVQQFISDLEDQPDYLRPERLAARLTALDQLDAILGDCTASHRRWNAAIIARMRALRARLEDANSELYEQARSEIIREGRSNTLRYWLMGPPGESESARPHPGLSFDLRDEILSGVLQLREPHPPDLPRSLEMSPYQPTPVRHILDLIASSGISEHDVLVDLGSGLGHVPLLVSILTGMQTLGIEFQPGYIASARGCARNLRITQTQFVGVDARLSDLSSGTVFYLFTPFMGSILTDVLCRLRKESTHRLIKICSLGPCTRALEHQPWLRASIFPDTGRIAVFESQ